MTGKGEMFKNEPETNLNSENGVTIQKDVWAVLQQQAQSLASKDRQIDELMNLLKEQIAENKKRLPVRKTMPPLPLPCSQVLWG